MSQREWLAWAAAAFIAVECGKLAAAAASAQGQSDLPLNAVRLIAWGCVVALLRRTETGAPVPAGRFATTLLMSGMTALLLPLDQAMFNLLAWALLSGAALLVLARPDRNAPDGNVNVRRAAAVMLAIAAQGFVSKWFAILFEGPILTLDTALAGLAMQVVTPGSAWSGHSIRPPGGVGVTLYLACSSFANLSLVCLCFVSLAALDGVVRWRRGLAVLAGLALVVVAVNTARIVLMAQSLPMYEYWHYGRGGQMLALALSAVTVALSSLGSRWAANG